MIGVLKRNSNKASLAAVTAPKVFVICHLTYATHRNTQSAARKITAEPKTQTAGSGSEQPLRRQAVRGGQCVTGLSRASVKTEREREREFLLTSPARAIIECLCDAETKC